MLDKIESRIQITFEKALKIIITDKVLITIDIFAKLLQVIILEI